jgi:hypothetical protein
VKVRILGTPDPKNIILSIDLMYFNGLVHLTTVSRNIRFITDTNLGNRRKKSVLEAMKQVIKIYQGKGHNVEKFDFNKFDENGNPTQTMIADREFQSLRDDLEGMGIEVNIVAKKQTCTRD